MSEQRLSDEEIAAIETRTSAEPKCAGCDRYDGMRLHAPEVCSFGWGPMAHGAIADARALLRDLRQARADLAAETATRTALRTQESRISGLLADAGVPVGDLVEGVRLLAQERTDALAAEQEAHDERGEMRDARGVLLAENDRLRARLADATGMLAEVTRR